MSIINDLFKRVTTTMESQLSAVTSFMVQVQNIGNQATQRVQQAIQKFTQKLLKKPDCKDDYWRLFGLYFSKRFVLIATVVVGVVGYLMISTVYPWAEGRLWTAQICLNSEKYTKFEGKAKVYDTVGVLVYNGSLSKGHPQGYGIQYTADGKLLYKGNFDSGKYSGEGEKYNSDGVMIYSGNFSNNLYEGDGKLFNDIGKVIYMGDFSSGMKNGYGVEYNPETNLKTYQGSFENGTRSGNGIEFESDGTTILYCGAFQNDTYSGKGKMYENGVILYEGDFINGLFEGQGTLYDLDMNAIKYSGEFKSGVYNGAGKLYDVNTSVVVYEGMFSNGKKQGEGTSYDKLGSQTFTGTFRSDGIDFIAYLGTAPDKVKEEFGDPSYITEKDDRMIITYLGLDVSIVFKVNEETGEYACEKIVLGTKQDFMGIGAQSTAIERRKVMGEPFSSINYSCPNYYKTVFSNLAININNISSIPTDKYIFDSYFIRFYFNEGRTELKCVEICSL